jgi:hypothetical protein
VHLRSRLEPYDLLRVIVGRASRFQSPDKLTDVHGRQG